MEGCAGQQTEGKERGEDHTGDRGRGGGTTWSHGGHEKGSSSGDGEDGEDVQGVVDDGEEMMENVKEWKRVLRKLEKGKARE